MKNFITVLTIVSAQVALGQDPDNAFSEAFEDMFAYDEPVFITQNTPPDPPVPLDGGLVALLAAGGAVAYKRYRSTKV
jgi:hypothetical protein